MNKMVKKGARQTFFVCAALTDQNKMVMKTLAATSPHEAANLFLEQYHLPAKEVAGPFFKKRAQVIEATRTLKFSDQKKKAEYEGWIVDALFLKDPENQAYLLFGQRIDGKKMSPPKGTIIVPVSDLRFHDQDIPGENKGAAIEAEKRDIAATEE
jgi:hypothetical protein